MENYHDKTNEQTPFSWSSSRRFSDPKYVEHFEKAYASADGATFGQVWTMGDIKVVLTDFEVRSATECGILCVRRSACAAWQIVSRNETTACLHLSSYQ